MAEAGASGFPDITKMPGYVDTKPMMEKYQQDQAALVKTESAALDKEQVERQPIIDKMKAIGDQDLSQFNLTDMPEPPPERPLLDANQFKDFFGTSMIFTALLGKSMKMNMYQGLGALNGAVKGYMLGNKEQADHDAAQFKEKTQYVLAHNKQVMDQLKAAVELPMEQQRARMMVISADKEMSRLKFALQHQTQADVLNVINMQDKANLHFADKAMAMSNHMDQIKMESARLAQSERHFQQQQGAAGGGLTPKASDLLDELSMRDSSFMSRMGVKSIAERNRIISDWAGKGITADDVMAYRFGTKATTKEVQVLAGQKASLDRVEKSLTMKDGVGDQVLEAAKKLDASKFRQINKISQFLNTEQSDNDLANYKLKLIALRDEFATVINKGGVPTEGSRAQATEMMDKYAPTAVGTIVQAVKDIANANQKAAEQGIKDAITGGKHDATTPAQSGGDLRSKYGLE